MHLFSRKGALLAALAVMAGASAPAQANWELVNRYTTDYLRPSIYSLSLTPSFIQDTDEFWYAWRSSDGFRYWRVNPDKRTKRPLVDSVKLAAQLSEVSRKPYDTSNLDLQQISFVDKSTTVIRFVIGEERFEYDTEKEILKSLGPVRPPQQGAPAVNRFGRNQEGQRVGNQTPPAEDVTNRPFGNYAPDKKRYVYALDHNLYYVEIVDGKETEPVQLSKDGAEDFSFGGGGRFGGGQQGEQQGQGQGRERRTRPGVTWSQDSARFYAMRFDRRKVKDLWLVNSLAMPRPTLLTYKYEMPGEPDVTQQELHVFTTATKELAKAKVDKYKDQQMFDIHWQETTSDSLRLVRRDRLQRNMELIELDLKNNEVKVLLTESVENAYLERRPVRYIKPGGDFIWWSERTGWGHLYLYSNDGKLKHAITSGPWRVEGLTDFDDKKNEIFLASFGREANENPYYRHNYRVNLDGSGLTLLDPGNADQSTTLTPSKNFAVSVYSRIDMAPEAVVRDRSGKVIMELEKADLSRLYETGWKMPETFKVKAADGVTDIYGNLWKPFDFDARKKYPIIAYVYPGPQTESVTANFSPTISMQRLAQLGFIVIQIGNRGGNPARSNAYHSYGYYNLRDYGLADKKAGMEQLAARHSFIDISRTGIYGHSGGGFMTAAALLLPPFNEFFKVGVSSAGNHDNNVYNSNWSEQHHGLREVPVTQGQGQAGQGAATGRTAPEELFVDEAPQEQTGTGTKFEIKVPTNAELAANLKGNLMLVHGDMDNNVHPVGTIRLINALIRANKRFEMIFLPGQAHGFGDMNPYFTQRMFEYFAQHLLDERIPSGADMVVRP